MSAFHSEEVKVKDPVRGTTGMTLQEERAQRVKKLRHVLTTLSLDVAVVQCMEDMYWLTGFNTPGAPRCQALVVTQEDVLISSRILEVTNALIHPMLHASSGHSEGDDPVTHLVGNILKYQPRRVGLQLDTDRTTPSDFQGMHALLTAAGCGIIDIQGVIRGLRSAKSYRELSLMRRAGELCAASVQAAINHTQENLYCTEGNVAAHAFLGARIGSAGSEDGTGSNSSSSGGDYAAYPPFICSGTKARLGHYAASQVNVPICNGDNVFYELAGCFQRYHVAITRTAHVATSLPAALQVR
jgi:Xaa-Pro dipeptidase